MSIGTAAAPAGRRFAVLSACCAARILSLCCYGHGQAAGPDAAVSASLNLTLGEAVHMALRNNRGLLGARLDRVVERFSLRVAENRFRPHVTVGPYVERTHTAPSADTDTAGLSSELTLRVPTGGEFAVRLDSGASTGDVASESRWSSALELAFRQPFLRGAGREIDTAPVRIARVEERIAVFGLRQAVIEVVTATIGRYLDCSVHGRCRRSPKLHWQSDERELLVERRSPGSGGRTARGGAARLGETACAAGAQIFVPTLLELMAA